MEVLASDNRGGIEVLGHIIFIGYMSLNLLACFCSHRSFVWIAGWPLECGVNVQRSRWTFSGEHKNMKKLGSQGGGDDGSVRRVGRRWWARMHVCGR